MPDPDYWYHMFQWLWENGWELCVGEGPPEEVEHYIATVDCGLPHATIWSRGRMVHNPWPGAGVGDWPVMGEYKWLKPVEVPDAA